MKIEIFFTFFYFIFSFLKFNTFTNRENVLNWGSGVFVDIRCIEPAESPKHRH